MSRVLLVDDDKKLLPLLGRGFRYEGFEVLAAATGKAGLTLARTRTPDVVVLDIGLPALDGLEVCRSLRRHADIPIIMLTARDEVADKVSALDLGADDYMTKPFAFDELVARVRALLRRRTPSQAASHLSHPPPAILGKQGVAIVHDDLAVAVGGEYHPLAQQLHNHHLTVQGSRTALPDM